MLWVGASFHVGGEILLGKDSSAGILFRSGAEPGDLRFIRYGTESFSAGIGLGGSSSLNLVIATNIDTEDQISKCFDGDFKFDYSLEMVISAASKYLLSIPQQLNKIHRMQGALGPGMNLLRKSANLLNHYGDIKDAAEAAWGAVNGASQTAKGKPTLIEIPVGLGMRVSAKMKKTTAYPVSSGIIQFADSELNYV